MAFREAARLVVGTLLMGSVPDKLVFDPKKAQDPEIIWPHQDNNPNPEERLNDWEWDRNLILILAAGVESDRIIQDGSFSDESGKDIEKAEEMIRKLDNKIRDKARKLDSEREKPEHIVKPETVIAKELHREVIFEDIIAGDRVRAFNRAREQMEKLLKRPEVKSIYNELGEKIVSGEEITADDFKKLFNPPPVVKEPLGFWASLRNLFRKKKPVPPPPPTLPKQILASIEKTPPGKAEPKTCRELLRSLDDRKAPPPLPEPLL
jgi:hypothetical protein